MPESVAAQHRASSAASVQRAEAFRRLVDGHLDDSYRLACAILGSPNDARDAVHDAFITGWQRWPSLRDPDRFGAWFKRIVVNHCKDRLRKAARRRRVPIGGGWAETQPDPAKAVHDRMEIEEGLKRLKPDDRIMLALRYYRDLRFFGVWPDDSSSAASGRTAVTAGAFADVWVGDLVIEQPEDEWSAGIQLRDDSFWLERRFWDLAANDSKVWLADPTGSLHRRTVSGWDAVDPPFPPTQIDVGPDGTLWIQAGEYHGWTEGATNEEVLSLMLARLDKGQWETWDRDDGIPAVGPVAFSYSFPPKGVHAVAPDGSIWLAALDHMAERECGGIVNFDGTTWTRYLDGLCVYDADLAPDGAVWLQAGEVSYDSEPGPNANQYLAPVDTYVITPEAAAATE